ncbi:MAG: hypothetical protein SFV21_12960 [Rhodospirillaceae bacterium]|nr:hypothetical protein [Rhodospirillaceae bacterium]
MKWTRVAAMTVAATALTACGGLPDRLSPFSSDPEPAAAPEPTPESATALEARIGELPAQSLRKGKCGLFLWTRTVDRKLVFFAESGDTSARMPIDGRQQYIPRVNAEGESVLGQPAQQAYVWRDLRVDVAIQFERRAGLARGAVVPQGTLKVSGRDGWEYLLPVGGLVACED